jgi:hypothetical protein
MNIAFITPCYREMSPLVAHAMAISIIPRLLGAGHSVQWLIEAEDPNSTRVRCVLHERFVASGFDRAVWIDADTLTTGEDVMALLAIEEDLVGALCSPRKLGGGWVGVPREPKNVRGVLLEADRVGFGMVSMSRACAVRMHEAAPTSFVPKLNASAGRRIPLVFDTPVENDTFITSDWHYSRRWQALGGRMWLHTGVKVGHIGSHVFRGASEENHACS